MNIWQIILIELFNKNKEMVNKFYNSSIGTVKTILNVN